MAHLQQIYWFEVMSAIAEIMETLKCLFDAMSNFHVGKASSEFAEKATELGYFVLKNKTYQKTRFVRSLVRGIQAALRNLPTICAILGEDLKVALQENNNTEAKNIQKILLPFQDKNKLAFIFGLTQILEIYTRCSMNVQHALWFPTMTWESINAAKCEIAS